MSEQAEHNPEFRGLCFAIGFVVANLTLIEQQIDLWVNVAFIDAGEHHFERKKVFRSRSAKRYGFFELAFSDFLIFLPSQTRRPR